ALGSPAIQSIWRAPAGTIPSAAAVQAHTHPCGPSSLSSPTVPPSHAASPAERFEILLATARHAAIVITAPPQAQSDSPERQVPSRNKQELPVRSQPSPPLRSCLAHPQRKRSRVPKRRRFRHSAPRLSSISDAWGRLNVVTPFDHLSEDSHLHRSLGAGHITASRLGRELINLPGKTGRRESALPQKGTSHCVAAKCRKGLTSETSRVRDSHTVGHFVTLRRCRSKSTERLPIFYGCGRGLPLERRFRGAPRLRHRIGTPRGLMQKQITLVPRHKFRARRNLDP